ncbi:plasminogen-like [Branchiostoma floridae x Branchiostoma belcheri]
MAMTRCLTLVVVTALMFARGGYGRECQEGDGTSYRGTVSETGSGLTCQAWGSQAPRPHRFRPEDYPDSGLEENYCRNPDADPMGPWCVTTSPIRGWEYCTVPSCIPNILHCLYSSQQTFHCTNGDCVPQEYVCDGWYDCGDWSDELSGCPCLEGDGTSYRGFVAETSSGLTCQSWDSQEPYQHDYLPENYPDSGLENNSFCRNPDEDPNGPWCITTDPDKEWEYCTIPLCGGRAHNNTKTTDTKTNRDINCGKADNNPTSSFDYNCFYSSWTFSSTKCECFQINDVKPHVHSFYKSTDYQLTYYQIFFTLSVFYYTNHAF